MESLIKQKANKAIKQLLKKNQFEVLNDNDVSIDVTDYPQMTST